MDKQNKVIRLAASPYTPGKPLCINMAYPVYEVMYEEGYISWREYAANVPPECRPAQYRYHPKRARR